MLPHDSIIDYFTFIDFTFIFVTPSIALQVLFASMFIYLTL